MCESIDSSEECQREEMIVYRSVEVCQQSDQGIQVQDRINNSCSASYRERRLLNLSLHICKLNLTRIFCSVLGLL